MNSKKIIRITLLISILFSCNKNAGKNIVPEEFIENDYNTFPQQNTSIVEMIHNMEYYKNEITKYQNNYYGFENVNMEITDIMNISSIMAVNNVIPNYLTFLVTWWNPKGYIYYLYTFTDEQKITGHYYLGQFNTFENYKLLMNKWGGEISKYGAVSVGDFNNNGINEILLYSFYTHIGDVFLVFEFNAMEKKLYEVCLVPVLINRESPFPSVEYIGNGFKILEVLDDELMEYAWNNYIWNSEYNKYIKY